MTVKQAREAAHQWMVQEGSRIPGFCGAYTAGSTNWLADDAVLATTSDLDIMIVLADLKQPGRRDKFIYHDILLELSYLRNDQLQSPDQILRDYHLAPSFRTTKVLFDPLGHLTALREAVSRDYSKRHWVHQRCAQARDKVLGHLQLIDHESPFHDQVTTCLFAAGIMAHVLLAAGLQNPTIRTRYVAVRELLAQYGFAEFHETLLQLLGSASINRGQAIQHVATLTQIFDVAQKVIRSPFPFVTDISNSARLVAIDGSFELIGRGYHREAMFWVAVAHSRCQKVLSSDTPREFTERFRCNYQGLVGDLGVPTVGAIRWRCAEIERTLPRVWKLAEAIIAANCEIEDD